MGSEIEYIESVSTYMLTLFLRQVAKRTNGRCDDEAILPAFISDDGLRDCESITKNMVDAFLHPGQFLHRLSGSCANIEWQSTSGGTQMTMSLSACAVLYLTACKRKNGNYRKTSQVSGHLCER